MELRGERGRSFGRLHRLLARGLVSVGDAEEMFELMLEAFDARAAALAQGVGFSDWNVAHNIPEAWKSLHDRHRHQDPSADQLGDAPSGTTYLIERDSTHVHKDTDLYHHFRDQGMRDGMVVRLHNPFRDDLYMVLYRTERDRPFDADDEQLFALIYPHLAGALSARRALGAIAGEEPAVTAHAYVSYPHRKVTWSRGARQLWRDTLQLDRDGWRRAEDVLRASAQQFFAGVRSQVVVPGIRVEWAITPPHAGERQRLLALMTAEPLDAREQLSPAEALLTPRQRTVANAIARGATAREVAAELGIGVETVRWTLRAVYRRLNVHRRAELAQALGRRDH